MAEDRLNKTEEPRYPAVQAAGVPVMVPAVTALGD